MTEADLKDAMDTQRGLIRVQSSIEEAQGTLAALGEQRDRLRGLRNDAIRRAVSDGAGTREIASRLGMSASSISEICSVGDLKGPGGIQMEVWNQIRDAVHDAGLSNEDEELVVSNMVTTLRGYDPRAGGPVSAAVGK